MPATTDNAVHRNTPTVTVLDSRGLVVRTIHYHRHPDTPTLTQPRITRQHHDAKGFMSHSSDPRLHERGRVNYRWLTDLVGNPLRTHSVDAGVSFNLGDAAGRPLLALQRIAIDDAGKYDRSQAVVRHWHYESASLPGRLLGISEQASGQAACWIERLVYAGNGELEKAHNLAGQPSHHYDTAGLLHTQSISLTGEPLVVTRRLLDAASEPDVTADWQGEQAAQWNAQLQPIARAHTTVTRVDATGQVVSTLDAAGHGQRQAYDVAGMLKSSWLTLKGGREQVILESVSYSAAGQKLREAHGNGLVTRYDYEPRTQRLAATRTERPVGHAHGAKVLQDLRYAYDPVGNVVSVRNDAEQTRFWRNQKVEPQSEYAYDSLYQLVGASGREMASAGQSSSQLPVSTPLDSSTYTRYSRTYWYDEAGNLTRIRHSAPASNNNYTTDITVSDRSNRAVSSALAMVPGQVEALFTADGLQTTLSPGQSLDWSMRGELLKVTPVVRETGVDDSEGYRYDSGNQRILKISKHRAANLMLAHQVLYLPGLELRTSSQGTTRTQDLQIIAIGEAGRAQVRALHWALGKPHDLPNDLLRYSYDDHLGSGTLEVDGSGALITREEYYPYGGTSVWSARSEVQGRYKFVRYSGKERDATGLYYYGYRYYQPWLCRWLSADPAGNMDGLNVFTMVRNNPLTLVDEQGLEGRPAQKTSAENGENQEAAEHKGTPSDTDKIEASASRPVSPEANTEGNEAMSETPQAAVGAQSANEHGTYIIRPEQRGVAETAFFKNLYGEGLLAYKTHGNPQGQLLNRLGQWDSASNVARNDIAPFLVGQPLGKPLMLIACFSGKSGAAQEVATALQRPVTGFPRADTVYTRHSSLMTERWGPSRDYPFGNEVLQDRSGVWPWVQRKVLRMENREIADLHTYQPAHLTFVGSINRAVEEHRSLRHR
ncbi:RHS repeat domain-containing protein [Pseudomonas sp. Teo4]|uniref:RHS repeat domain-containing protein n=1 Tax=Pseudomonas sp. Teo4 TaxID=3064528 RepID=UPI002AB8F861|nr:RHS repeat domain-containing protein [Pseudomonas sp. Teo4]MDZ3991200.1 hypothetical protein [Pseudomonas sp. Teo4]